MLFLWGCEMNEKMTYEKAREIVKKYYTDINAGISTHVTMTIYDEPEVKRLESFIEGHESRQPEIDELNKQIEELGYKLRVKLAEEVLREAR